MGSKINITQSNIGSVGDNNTLNNPHFELSNNNPGYIDFPKLVIEINKLTAAFEKHNTGGQHTELIKELKVTEEEAKAGDIETVKKKISPIKDTLLKLAKSIGVEMAASWITKQAGL